MADKEIGDMSLEELRDYIRNNPFLRSNKWGEILAGKSASIEKRISKIEEEQKKNKLVLGDEEVKKIVGERYRELVEIQIKEAIKGKKGVVHTINKVIGYATGGLGLLVILSVLGLGIYFTNRTTTGNIIGYQNKVKSLEGQIKKEGAEIKKYSDRADSIEEAQKNYDQLKTRLGSYDITIPELRNAYDKQKQDCDQKFDELEKKIIENEKSIERKIKANSE